MMDNDLDLLLRTARDDTAPLGGDLRARILTDAADQARPAPGRRLWRDWLGGLLGVPTATALGLWIGIAQADVVLTYVPGSATETSAADALLLDEVFGSTWGEGETG